MVFHIRLYEVANELQAKSEALHKALGDHLMLVALAMRGIEEVENRGAKPGSEIPAIEKVLGCTVAEVELGELLTEGRGVLTKLAEAIAKLEEPEEEIKICY